MYLCYFSGLLPSTGMLRCIVCFFPGLHFEICCRPRSFLQKQKTTTVWLRACTGACGTTGNEQLEMGSGESIMVRTGQME